MVEKRKGVDPKIASEDCEYCFPLLRPIYSSPKTKKRDKNIILPHLVTQNFSAHAKKQEKQRG